MLFLAEHVCDVREDGRVCALKTDNGYQTRVCCAARDLRLMIDRGINWFCRWSTGRCYGTDHVRWRVEPRRRRTVWSWWHDKELYRVHEILRSQDLWHHVSSLSWQFTVTDLVTILTTCYRFEWNKRLLACVYIVLVTVDIWCWSCRFTCSCTRCICPALFWNWLQTLVVV